MSAVRDRLSATLCRRCRIERDVGQGGIAMTSLALSATVRSAAVRHGLSFVHAKAPPENPAFSARRGRRLGSVVRRPDSGRAPRHDVATGARRLVVRR